jgi:hypothetical protein
MLKTLEAKDTCPIMELFGNLGQRVEDENGARPEPVDMRGDVERHEHHMSAIVRIDVYSLPEDTCS